MLLYWQHAQCGCKDVLGAVTFASVPCLVQPLNSLQPVHMHLSSPVLPWHCISLEHAERQDDAVLQSLQLLITGMKQVGPHASDPLACPGLTTLLPRPMLL